MVMWCACGEMVGGWEAEDKGCVIPNLRARRFGPWQFLPSASERAIEQAIEV